MVDDFREWREATAARARTRAAGGCTCCAGMVGPPIGRRICWWVLPSGHRESLCATCYDHWADNAKDDPSLAPRIVEFDAA